MSKRTDEEMKRVRELKTSGTFTKLYAKSSRIDKSKFWVNAFIELLPSVSGKGSITLEALITADILVILYSMNISSSDLSPIRGINQLQDMAIKQAISCSCPNTCEIDHHLAQNPYQK